MAVLKFVYNLMYQPGYEQENPIGPTEAPLNLIAVSESTDQTLAVIWDYPTKTWAFKPRVAVTVLYAVPERHRVRTVDRATAEREASRFATTPLPTEAELTEICRLGLLS